MSGRGFLCEGQCADKLERQRMEFEHVKPLDIEGRSFEIITDELSALGKELNPETELIVKRVIHTSADFDYADNMYFSKGAVKCALDAIKRGAVIVTDTTMALSGINKKSLANLGCDVRNYIADADVADFAKRLGVTRSAVSMDKAYAELFGECADTGSSRPVIFAIGNAPTALVRLHELYTQKGYKPDLIIGVPVGFVNVVQAKELIIETDIPCIVARGRKGGSNVAAAIVNALLYQVTDRGYK